MNRIAMLLTVLLASPAAAEVLVFAGGDHYVEIQGDYQVKGRRVVYTDKTGKLCSVAAADVDLPRSAALSLAQSTDDKAAFVGMKDAGAAVVGQRELEADTLPDWLRRTESGSALAWDQFAECASVGDHTCTSQLFSKHGGYLIRRANFEQRVIDRRVELAKARATQNVANAVGRIK